MVTSCQIKLVQAHVSLSTAVLGNTSSGSRTSNHSMRTLQQTCFQVLQLERRHSLLKIHTPLVPATTLGMGTHSTHWAHLDAPKYCHKPPADPTRLPLLSPFVYLSSLMTGLSKTEAHRDFVTKGITRRVPTSYYPKDTAYAV